jgi:formylglycine-generating enzyme required for sulfatase activity
MRHSWFKKLTLLFAILVMLQNGYASPKRQKNSDWAQAVLKTKSEIKTIFSSDVMKAKQEAKKISVDISNLDQLALVTWGTRDGSGWDHSVWANAKLITNDGEEVWLDEKEFLYAKAGWGNAKRNKNAGGKTIRVGSKKYEHGVFVHADGEVLISLNKKYKRFEAEIGIDRGSRTGTVIFKLKNKTTGGLVANLAKKFPQEMAALSEVSSNIANAIIESEGDKLILETTSNLINKLEKPAYFRKEFNKVNSLPKSKRELEALKLFKRVGTIYNVMKETKYFNLEALALAYNNMKKSPNFPVSKYEGKFQNIYNNFESVKSRVYQEDTKALAQLNQMLKVKREILLANPLLDMDKIIAVSYNLKSRARSAMGPDLGTPRSNWSGNMSMNRSGFDCEIIELSNLRGELKRKTLYKPEEKRPVSNVKLHWDADRLMFSSVDKENKWQIYEISSKGSKAKQLTHIDEDDLEFFDGTYLPSGKIICNSNVGYNGVPCVNGSDIVSNLCLYDPKTNNLRRLNFGQDNDWNPAVMNNGRVMYTRWEYTDNTHYFSRIMMHMNPDGTNKKELYGSGSYWPNSMFNGQPLPGNNNNKFIAIVSGHHGIARSGRLVMFDPMKGRQEEKGVIQEIPYRNKKVIPEVKDRLVDGVWPQFLNPMPLSQEYFLVTAKLSPGSLWNLYLVDVFDNVTELASFEGEGLIDAIPLVKKPTPPVIPEKIIPSAKESTIFIQDIYEGKGLKGVPRGTVKKLRVFAYEYAYIKSPSNHMAHGIQSAWDMKRVLGEVPVEKDGSVMFKVPSNLPISFQPLDKDGAAIQQMRSWMTAMPGEVASCVGCHEHQNSIAKPKFAMAARKKPQTLVAPEGGVRTFTFKYEVQPLLDKKCIACHNGSNDLLDFKDGSLDKVTGFGKSYLALHPYVNRQGPESDIHTMKPMEFHVSTSPLIQELKRGHHNVKLTDEEFKVLYTWIDLNAPYNGTFRDKNYNKHKQTCRRRELSKKYAGIEVNWEEELESYIEYLNDKGEIKPEKPKRAPRPQYKKVELNGWPFAKSKAVAMQKDLGNTKKSFEIAPGVKMNFVKIPAGEFVMGSETGYKDEFPKSVVKIDKAYWMAEMEISNEQYNAIYPEHDSRFIHQYWKDHVNQGYAANKPQQPVIRVSWEEANKYCEKLSEKLGVKVTLPTEAQWEWAARAGSDQAFWFGNSSSDFSSYANLSDKQMRNMAVTGVDPKPMSEGHPLKDYFDYLPRSKKFDDGEMITAHVDQYQPNYWGLKNMIGNVSEWTKSDYKAYPYVKSDNNPKLNKVVRGGNWRDHPSKASSSSRNQFKPWQKVMTVGFRVIIEE